MICPVDRQQVESTLNEARTKLDALSEHLIERERVFHRLPTGLFLAFAAVSQVLGQTPSDQYALLRAALEQVDLVMVGRVLGHYGGARRCADVTRATAMATLVAVRKAVADTNLLRGGLAEQEAARGVLLYRSLFDYCAYSRLLAPSNTGEMIAAVNGFVSEILQSGELDKNVVKVR